MSVCVCVDDLESWQQVPIKYIFFLFSLSLSPTPSKRKRRITEYQIDVPTRLRGETNSYCDSLAAIKVGPRVALLSVY